MGRNATIYDLATQESGANDQLFSANNNDKDSLQDNTPGGIRQRQHGRKNIDIHFLKNDTLLKRAKNFASTPFALPCGSSNVRGKFSCSGQTNVTEEQNGFHLNLNHWLLPWNLCGCLQRGNPV